MAFIKNLDFLIEDLQNKFFTSERAKEAAVVNASSGTQTDQAMSVQAAKNFVSAELSGVEADVSTLQSDVTGLQDQINNVLSNIDPDALDSLSEIVNAFQEEDGNLSGAITSLSSALSIRLDTAEADITGLESRMGAAEGEIGYLSGAITGEEFARQSADSYLSGVLTGVDSRLSTAEADITGLDSRLSTAEADITGLDSRLSTAEADITGLEESKVDETENYDIKPGLYDVGSVAGGVEIDFANGPTQKLSLTGAATVSAFQNPVQGGVYFLQLVQDGTGGRQIAWPSGINWANGSAPVLSSANKVDFVQIWYDGSEFYADYQLEDVTFATSSELSGVSGGLASLEGRMDTAESDITGLEADVDYLSGAITATLSAAEAYTDLAVSGLASESYADGAASAASGAALSAAQDYTDAAVSGLASEAYVDSAVSGLASEEYVNNLIGDLEESETVVEYVGSSIIDLRESVDADLSRVRKELGPVTMVSESMTLADEILLLCDVSEGSLTLTLPIASEENSGRRFVIKDNGSASEGQFIRIQPSGEETLDGEEYYDIKVAYESVTVVTDENNWYIV